VPPRFVYWTILIDNAPTAFRARERDDLLPTVAQLRRRNADVVLKWFAHGRLWASPDEERRAAAARPREARGRDWRPGGEHKDPRARFKEAERKRRQEKRAHRFEKKQAAGPRPDRRPSRPYRPPPRKDRRQARPAEPPRKRRDQGGAAPPPAPGRVAVKPKPPERG